MRGSARFDNTGIVSTDDLIVTLRKEPTPEEHAIAEGVGLHDGSHVPFHMFAKVAAAGHKNANWIGSMDGLMNKARRRALGALGALAFNLAALGGFLLHGAREEGAAGERAMQVEREIQDLRLDVRELRAAMRRMSGADSIGPGSSDETPNADKLSIVDGALQLLTTIVPSPGPQPRTCGDICNSNLQCASHFGRVCPFCSFGSCSATMPQDPIPVDAGIDAPGGTQP